MRSMKMIRVIASEIMQVDDLQFEREEPNRIIRPPVVRPNTQQNQSNWLLIRMR